MSWSHPSATTPNLAAQGLNSPGSSEVRLGTPAYAWPGDAANRQRDSETAMTAMQSRRTVVELGFSPAVRVTRQRP
jgi:hypothetical protein